MDEHNKNEKSHIDNDENLKLEHAPWCILIIASHVNYQGLCFFLKIQSESFKNQDHYEITRWTPVDNAI